MSFDFLPQLSAVTDSLFLELTNPRTRLPQKLRALFFHLLLLLIGFSFKCYLPDLFMEGEKSVIVHLFLAVLS